MFFRPLPDRRPPREDTTQHHNMHENSLTKHRTRTKIYMWILCNNQLTYNSYQQNRPLKDGKDIFR